MMGHRIALAAVVGATSASLFTLPTPAAAAPGDCTNWSIPGAMVVVVTLTGASPFNIEYSTSGGKYNNPARTVGFPIADVDGKMDAEIVSETKLVQTFSTTGPKPFKMLFDGTIGPDGTAGGAVNRDGHTEGSWRSTTPLVCDDREAAAPPAEAAEPAKLPGPTVTSEAVIGGLVIHVKDNSGVASNCTYTSALDQRDFRLEANSVADIRIVPALPLFKQWGVNITCDNGAATTTNLFF